MLTSRRHPGVAKKFLGRDAKIAIFLKAVIEEIFDDLLVSSSEHLNCKTYWRGTIWDGRIVVLYNAEERLHRGKVMIRLFAFQELDDYASYTPEGEPLNHIALTKCPKRSWHHFAQ